MKKNIYNILMTVSAMLFMTACNDVVFSEASEDTGYMNVSLGVDDDVATKAIVTPSQDMAFRIEIYRGSELVKEVADHRNVTQSAPIELKVGKYKVKAIYGNNTAGFDVPYYVGETEVLITADDITTADLTCSLANVMVTVEFDQSIVDNFASYSISVDDGSGQDIEFDSTNPDAVGYIPATGSLRWTLTLTNDGGETYTHTETYTDVRARQHYTLHIGLSEMTGDIGYAAIKLIVDDTLVEQKYDIELDFSEAEMPAVSTEGFELTNEISVLVGDASKKELSFAAPEGIDEFYIELESDVQLRSSATTIYQLVDASPSVLDALAALGIKTQSISYGATSFTIDVTDYVKALPTGKYHIDCKLYDTRGHVVKVPMTFAIISDVDADMVSVSPWAKFAVLTGKYFSSSAPDGIGFMYRKSSESSWTTISAGSVDSSTKTFEAEIGGLDANSTYVVKAVSSDDTETREVEFTTETAGTLYNMNFEDWYADGKIYYPYTSGANPSVWDCANRATASFVKSYTTPDTYTATSSSKNAARMESAWVVIKFAAGNLFTGKFCDFSTKGAELDWGVPFTSRPVALRGYYDYNSGNIDRVPKDGSYDHVKGHPDKCQIMVFLTTWTEPFHINTVEGEFVDFSESNKSIVAVGKLESSVTTNGYTEFVIPLEYRNTDVTPTYVVITCCSSYLGDYFTGSTSSLLYVDDFTFEYDVTTLTDDQKAKVNYR